ncbi:MAG: hypothetical protein IKA59_02230 [Clostridia bacterium]|nr:hypothetical protein [Clostridia bacterium]
MKKQISKKILSVGLIFILVFAMLLTFVACDEDTSINVRINNGYVQWQETGASDWTNLISVDEIKGLLGAPSNGKEIELRTNDTHIQWRYIVDGQGANDGWTNLYALEDLKDKPPVVDNTISEEDKQQAFEVFTAGLNAFKYGHYKITYDYRNDRAVEYYGTYNIVGGTCMAISVVAGVNGWVSVDNSDPFRAYTINAVGLKYDNAVPKSVFTSTLKYIPEADAFKYMESSGTIYYGADTYTERGAFEYRFISFLKNAFTVENVVNIQSNADGNQIITLTCNSKATKYLSTDYIYDFCITSEGKIAKCYVYEKDFMDNSKKGDLFCIINYDEDTLLEIHDIFEEAFDSYNQFMVDHDAEDRVYENWDDAFHYETVTEN